MFDGTEIPLKRDEEQETPKSSLNPNEWDISCWF